MSVSGQGSLDSLKGLSDRTGLPAQIQRGEKPPAEKLPGEIYVQDCEFYRYQDRLKWSRFQTAATLEAAVLAAVYTLQLDSCDRRSLLLLSTTIILSITSLAFLDSRDAKKHLKRIRIFETKWPFDKTAKVATAGSISSKNWEGAFRKAHFVPWFFLLLNVVNGILIWRKW